MNRIIVLLKNKNHFLERFFLLNEVEMLNFEQGNFDHLERFYEVRDEILKVIGEIDQKLDLALKNLAVEDLDQNDLHERISKLVSEKESLVAGIVDQDLRILSLVEKEKTQMIQDLTSVQKARRAMKGYQL